MPEQNNDQPQGNPPQQSVETPAREFIQIDTSSNSMMQKADKNDIPAENKTLPKEQ
jgi:hypothetical protein